MSEVLCKEKQKKEDENNSDLKMGILLEEAQQNEEKQSYSFFSGYC